MKNLIASAALTMAASTLAPAADAATLVVDLVRATSFGFEGSARNTILTFDIGAYARVTKLDYDFTLTALDPSWLVDHSVQFGTSSGAFVSFSPGYEMAYEGTELFVGTYDWLDLGQDFFVDDDGLLKLEFTDSYHVIDIAAGYWNGTFTMTYDAPAAVPEPATWTFMILGFGAVGGALRRQRRIRTAMPA